MRGRVWWNEPPRWCARDEHSFGQDNGQEHGSPAHRRWPGRRSSPAPPPIWWGSGLWLSSEIRVERRRAHSRRGKTVVTPRPAPSSLARAAPNRRGPRAGVHPAVGRRSRCERARQPRSVRCYRSHGPDRGSRGRAQSPRSGHPAPGPDTAAAHDGVVGGGLAKGAPDRIALLEQRQSTIVLPPRTGDVAQAEEADRSCPGFWASRENRVKPSSNSATARSTSPRS